MEEDLGVLLSSMFIVITCMGGKEGKRGQWGLGKGTKKVGHLSLSMGPARAEVRNYVQRATIPTMMVIHTLNIQKIAHMQ
jgi:hypothetical protein